MIKLLYSIISVFTISLLLLSVTIDEYNIDMGVVCIVKIENNNKTYFYSIWNDTLIKQDSLQLHKSNGEFKYTHVKDYLIEQDFSSSLDTTVYESFRVFDMETYFRSNIHNSKWPVLSKPADVKLKDILKESSKVSIENLFPFEGHFYTPALADDSWEWIKAQDFELYFYAQDQVDGFCTSFVFGPKGIYSDRILEEIKSRITAEIIMSGNDEYLNYLYFEYDIIVSGYCSC